MAQVAERKTALMRAQIQAGLGRGGLAVSKTCWAGRQGKGPSFQQHFKGYSALGFTSSLVAGEVQNRLQQAFAGKLLQGPQGRSCHQLSQANMTGLTYT